MSQLIREVKTSYYKTKLLKAENNPKLKWKILGELTAKHKKPNNLHKIITTDGVEINVNEYPKLIANNFNEYYINIASNLITKLNDRNEQLNKNSLNIDTQNSNTNILPNIPNLDKFENITIDEILKAITTLKNGSAPGSDKITSEILKNHNEILCNPLKHIYNLSITKIIYLMLSRFR